MLDAAEWTELAVFQRHYNDIKSIYSKYDTLYNDEQVILRYFEDRIKTLQKKDN